ncbi:Uncharacterized protein FWK35_00020552 [Aphis craccivora]|uniref:Uncharacterized protein n=1 Tax=Aphis craccivora TaxID=307492 RepID=A0A6G0Y164_APHCR|nr:Uncharacterized protein FWK35_00020552 [Aphis craccivora]
MDPEDTRSRRQVYPTLSEEDYVYAQTAQLRRWVREEIRKSEEEEIGSASSSGEEDEQPTAPRARPRMPLPSERKETKNNAIWKEREVKAGISSSTEHSDYSGGKDHQG